MGSKLAVQMYTLREHTATRKDLQSTLKRVAGMGYPAVQFSAVGCMGGDKPEVTAADAKKMLDDNGLKCIATHRGWDSLVDRTQAEIEFHHALGCDYVAIGGLPQAYGSRGEAGYRAFVKDAQPVLKTLKKAGLTFGYHNHSHEFVRIGPGRRTLYDIFIEEGGSLLTLELDTYWVQHAGVTPDRIIERCHGRLPVIHVKDKEVLADKGPVMSPVGEGNLDWDHILPACEAAGVKWYAVEQDTCQRDPFDCLRSSFEFLSSKGL